MTTNLIYYGGEYYIYNTILIQDPLQALMAPTVGPVWPSSYLLTAPTFPFTSVVPLEECVAGQLLRLLYPQPPN